MQKKIVTVIGARPQFIKAAVVSRALKKDGGIEEVIIHTGQHYDNNMSDIFFTEMEIPRPAYNLAIHESLHGAMTGKMLAGIEQILLKENPAIILVYGDTNSTLAGALAASKMHLKVAHVEAGLRSFNMKMPEEINRIITDRISKFLFCPTDTAMKNLAAEGFEQSFYHLFNTGDVMFDAALYYFKKSNDGIIKRLGIKNDEFILSTIHRAENTDDINNLRSIINALNTLHKNVKVIVPLHPRTKKIIQQNNITTDFIIIDPVGYFDMMQLLANCKLVITDSGGLQKEAYFFKKFCVIMREQTEWVELVASHYSKLSGCDENKIVSSALGFLQESFPMASGLYGDGNAGDKIISILNRKAFD